MRHCASVMRNQKVAMADCVYALHLAQCELVPDTEREREGEPELRTVEHDLTPPNNTECRLSLCLPQCSPYVRG